MVYSTQFAGADEQFATRFITALGATFLVSTKAFHSVHSDHDDASVKQEVWISTDAVLAGANVWAEQAAIVWTRDMPLRLRLKDSARGVGTCGYPWSTRSSLRVPINDLFKGML